MTRALREAASRILGRMRANAHSTAASTWGRHDPAWHRRREEARQHAHTERWRLALLHEPGGVMGPTRLGEEPPAFGGRRPEDER